MSYLRLSKEGLFVWGEWLRPADDAPLSGVRQRRKDLRGGFEVGSGGFKVEIILPEYEVGFGLKEGRIRFEEAHEAGLLMHLV